MIEKFIIPQLDEEELHAKLSDIRYPNEFQDDSVGWSCGAPTWAVQNMVHEWKHNFRWEKSREEINRWHHYQTNIEDLNIHFVHEPSANDHAIPLILLHGWPSTFYEFHKLIEPLRDGHNNVTQSFHVVVPSLPGYGFSEAPKHPGRGGVPQFANIMDQLMTKLGYEKYMVFGTDWGAGIGTAMAQNYANHCLGFLTTMPLPPPPMPTLANLLSHPFKVLSFLLGILLGFDKVYDEIEAKSIATGSFANAEKTNNAGYRAIQGTRPYTLSYGLTDSPVGLLSWMLEPYHAWTFIEGSVATANKLALPDTITTDEFLTQVTIYWITNTMSSSIRLYYETMQAMKNGGAGKGNVHVPMGVAYFANEVIRFPRDWIEAFAKNLIQYKSYPKGGHFASLEVPDLLLNDIQQFGATLTKKTQTGKKNL